MMHFDVSSCLNDGKAACSKTNCATNENELFIHVENNLINMEKQRKTKNEIKTESQQSAWKFASAWEQA